MHEEIERTLSDMETIVNEARKRISRAISPHKFLQLAQDLDKIADTNGIQYLHMPYKYGKQVKEALGGSEARALELGEINRLKDLNIVLQEQSGEFIEQITVPRRSNRRGELVSEVRQYSDLADGYVKDLIAQDELFVDRNREVQIDWWGPLSYQIRTIWHLLCALTAARDLAKRVHEIHARLGEIERALPPAVTLRKAKLFGRTEFAVDMNLCFVLMPFKEPFNGIYEEIIKATIEGPEVGMICKRADDIYGTRAVMEDVWEHVNKAAVVIAELTGRNPNVFYELGLSHAVGTETILITQDASEIPLDLKHLRFIVYKDDARGHKKLAKDLVKTLQAARESTRPND